MKLNQIDNQLPPVNAVEISEAASLQEASDSINSTSSEIPYGYVYLTNHLNSYKVYVGLHSGSKFDKNYLGSGCNILKAIKKHGRKSFSVTLLVWCSTVEEMNREEIRLIALYRKVLGYENVYNLNEGGHHEGFQGMKQSPETIEKRAIKLRGQKRTQETKELNRIRSLGRRHTEKTKQHLHVLAEKNKAHNILTHTGRNNARYGKKHTPETLAKMREKALGRTHTEQTKKKLRTISLGKTAWNKGVLQTEEVKKKISASLSGRTLSLETKKKISDWNQNNPLSDEARKRISESSKGRIVSEETRKKLSESGKGRILSEASRLKMSLSAQARRKKIVNI